jgi:hypothetical protein
VLARAAAALSSLKTVRMDVGFGSGLSIDELTLYSASAAVELPGASEASFRVRRGGFLADLGVIGRNGRRYIRIPPAPFQEMSPADGSEIPDPAALFDPRLGLPGLLPTGAHPTYVAGGAVSAEYRADRLQPLIRAQPAGAGTATMWTGRTDHLPRRIVFTGTLRDAGKRFQAELLLHDFDQPVNIPEPPVL